MRIRRIFELLPVQIRQPTFQYLRWKFIRIFRGSRFALNDLDRKLEKYVDYDNGFYVELGANDGANQSNSYYFELKRGWKGLLVEPSPHNFLSCIALRGKNNSVFCNACVADDYDKRMVEIAYADLMSISIDLESDLISTNNHVKKTLQQSPRFTFGAIARTLSSLLDESGAPTQIDFLSLDVEGAELDVLRGINFNKYTFKYILVECRQFDRLNQFLEKMEYKFIENLSHHDYLFQKIER